MKNSKKEITTKAEQELANLIGFNGIYVKSLIKSAQRHTIGATISELLRNYKSKIKNSKKAEAKKFGLSRKAFESLKVKGESILADFSTGYSMGEYRKLYIPLRAGTKEIAANHNLDTYARSCTWSPTYGSIKIEISKKDLKAIQKIEGIWTVVSPDGSAKWLAGTGSKGNYSVEWVTGFVFGSTHSKISIDAARADEIKKTEQKIQQQQNDQKFIGFAHMRDTGACESGIIAFCQKHGLNKDFGYQLGYLKSLQKSIYLQQIKTA